MRLVELPNGVCVNPDHVETVRYERGYVFVTTRSLSTHVDVQYKDSTKQQDADGLKLRDEICELLQGPKLQVGELLTFSPAMSVCSGEPGTITYPSQGEKEWQQYSVTMDQRIDGLTAP